MLELVLVVAILAVISAIAVPRLSRAAEGAKPVAFARTLDAFADAILEYRYTTGQWPEDGNTGVVPAELLGRVDENAWNRPTPAGGSWDADQDHSDVYGIGVVGPDDIDILTRLDAIIDDGDLTTGSFQQLSSDRYYLILGPR